MKTKFRQSFWGAEQVCILIGSWIMTLNANISISGFYWFCRKTRENVAIKFFYCDRIFSSFIMEFFLVLNFFFSKTLNFGPITLNCGKKELHSRLWKKKSKNYILNFLRIFFFEIFFWFFLKIFFSNPWMLVPSR